MDRREADLFVGRSEELSLLASLFTPQAISPVGFIHGPGGIGKSALLRRVTNLAREQGHAIEWVDGRSPGAADDIRSAVARLGDDPTLLVVDTYEAVQGIDADLRARLADRAAGRWRVLIAGRHQPAPAWGWPPWNESLVLRLEGLERKDSILYLERRGVTAGEGLIDWARGEPLALAVAADAASMGIPGSDRLDDEVIARTLLRRLVGEGKTTELLIAASVARTVDAATLETLVPGVDRDGAAEWLKGLTIAEPLDGRMAIHARVRQSVRSLVGREDPAHLRDVRRRLADHLYSRTRSGEWDSLTELAELLEDPRLQWGLGVEQAATHHADRLRPGDEEVIQVLVEPSQPRRWEVLARWLRDAPEYVVAVRDRQGDLAGVGIYLTCDDSPAWAENDPVLSRWLPHARSTGGNCLISRGGVAVRWTPDRAALGNSLMAARWQEDWRRVYAVGYPKSAPQIAFLQAMGYRRTPELDVRDGEQPVRSYILDLEHGVAAHMHSLVYRELGLAPAGPPDMVAEVHHLLRNYHDATALAATTLARGSTVTERAQSVRLLIEEAVSCTFGDTADEVLMRRILEQGYLATGSSHEQAARTLHLGRSTYFRRLGRAVERVAVYLHHAR